jgi:S-disulfanyl-L-cysteine oxidoreductase SoxD
MSRLAKALSHLGLIIALGWVVAGHAEEAGHFGYGQTATAEQIAGWDIDIRPDGMGLPPGGATPEDGEMLYEDKCASCHGSFGEGVGRYPSLSGGEGTLTEARPEKTVGSFWPYASTLWDYIHRAMPFTAPESLTDEEVYATTAYVLYLNDLIEYDFELTRENLADVEMPNKDGFFFDDRPDVKAKRCMKNCKKPGSIKITSKPEVSEDTDSGADEIAAVEQTKEGKAVYQQACSVCHATGIGEAPIPGDNAAWSARLAPGRDALIESALNGKGIMPAKGGQLQLSNAAVTAAVDYMISLSAKQ